VVAQQHRAFVAEIGDDPLALVEIDRDKARSLNLPLREVTDALQVFLPGVFVVLVVWLGARYAAELGTMRVTEQIDALEALGRNPVSHLLIPRIAAGVLMVPALVMIADLTGLLMGWLAAKSALHITDADFIYGTKYFFRTFDLWYSLIKAEVFGIVVTLIPCYVGFSAESGAEGVGRATTKSVAILILDTVLAKILLPTP